MMDMLLLLFNLSNLSNMFMLLLLNNNDIIDAGKNFFAGGNFHG